MADQTLTFSLLTTISEPGGGQPVSRPATAPTKCGECELPLRWEQIDDGSGERWLAVCACGMPWVFFPGPTLCGPIASRRTVNRSRETGRLGGALALGVRGHSGTLAQASALTPVHSRGRRPGESGRRSCNQVPDKCLGIRLQGDRITGTANSHTDSCQEAGPASRGRHTKTNQAERQGAGAHDPRFVRPVHGLETDHRG